MVVMRVRGRQRSPVREVPSAGTRRDRVVIWGGGWGGTVRGARRRDTIRGSGRHAAGARWGDTTAGRGWWV